jgi:RNA recognition motif-containing protein
MSISQEKVSLAMSAEAAPHAAPADREEGGWPPAAAMPRRIFVNNFPYTSREEELRAFFAQAGEIVSLKLLTTQSGSLRGQALIQYATAQAGEEAIRRFDGAEFNGRRLNVEYSRQGDHPPRRRSPPRRSPPFDPRRHDYESRYPRYPPYDPYEYEERFRRPPYGDPYYGSGYPPPHWEGRYRDPRPPWPDSRDPARRRY